jgi:GNAT superfamily N-acetyltransferase
MQTIRIRPYRPGDLEQLVALWHASKRRAFPYVEVQQRYTLENDRDYFRSTVVPGADIWVAHRDDIVLGFMALEDDLIDLLFVAIGAQGQGVGTALVNRAKALSPDGLRAYTFQRNDVARSFLAQQGFVEIRLGVSPPPEDEPDVELAWVPGADG